MGHAEHKTDAPARVACAVVTVSDTRTPETDTSGRTIREILEAHGHPVVRYQIVRDDPDQIRGQLRELAAAPDVQAVLLTGGTGIAPRDHTYDVVAGLLEKRLDGFGELFRHLSFLEIGSAAMLSRAVGGVLGGKPVFSMPGSAAAARLATERLIAPELGHLMRELRR